MDSTSKSSLLPSDEGSSNRKSRITTALILSTIIGCVGSAQFGFSIGVLNEPESVIEAALNIPSGSFMWSAANAVLTVAAFVGSQVLSPFLDSLGRRPYLIYYQILFVVSGLLGVAVGYVAPSSPSAGYGLLLASRAFAGFGSGGAFGSVPLYLGETAPRALRGTFGSLPQLTITIFLALGQALGLFMSTSGLWYWMLAVHAGLGIFALVGGCALVESPRWLVARGREGEARKALATLRGYRPGAESPEDEAEEDAEIAEMTAAAADSKGKASPSILSVACDKNLRWQLIVIVTLQVIQQLSGINAVFFYSSSFFKDAGVSNPGYGTLGAGAVNVAATILAVFIVDRSGRKPLLLGATAGMLVAGIALTLTLVLKTGSAPAYLGDISIAFVLLFVIFFAVGLGPTPSFIGGELLSEGPRASGMAIGVAANMFFTTVVALCFPAVQSALGAYSFLPFVIILGLAFVFIFFCVPETAGKTPQQLAAWFRGRKAGDEEGEGAPGGGETPSSALLMGNLQSP